MATQPLWSADDASKPLAMKFVMGMLTVLILFIMFSPILLVVKNATSPKVTSIFDGRMLASICFCLFLLYFGVLFFQRVFVAPWSVRNKKYDLFEDRIEIMKSDGTTQIMLFESIETVHRFHPPGFKKGLKGDLTTIRNFIFQLRFVMPFDAIIIPALIMSTQKAGEIHIRVRSATGSLSLIKYFLVWQKTPPKRDFALIPTNLQDFYQRFTDALNTWRKKQGTAIVSESTDTTVRMELSPSVAHNLFWLALSPMIALVVLWILMFGSFVLNTMASSYKNLMPQMILLGVISILLLGYAGFYWFFPYWLMKKNYPKMCYRFFKTRVEFPGSLPELATKTIDYRSIKEIRIRKKLLQRFQGTGTIEICTSEVVGEHVYGAGMTSIFIPNIDHPEKKMEEIKGLVGRDMK
jgi:hypothetical protein